MIDDLKKRLSAKGIGLVVDEKAKNYLIEKGYDPKNGARPLRRCIEDEVESILSEKLIAGEFKKGDIPVVTLKKGKITI